MKTAHAANERTPLLGNGATSNKQTPPIGEETTSNSNNAPPIISCPRIFEPETNEVSQEEVVQALFSAWRRHKVLKAKVALDFFTTKEFYAMHVAWANVTRGRHCSSAPHIIAEALADAIADYLDPDESRNVCAILDFNMKKCIVAANLLDSWQMITEEDEDWEFPVRYTESIFEDSNDQPTAVSEFRLGRVELYDKAHDFILNPKLQVFLHNFLIIWPISILIIGSKYMECPMGHHLSYLFVILGCAGCLAILGRLALMHLSSLGGYPFHWFWKWNSLRLLEFTFLVLFIVQAFHFFLIDPPTEPDPQTCVKNFYNAALLINYVSIPIISAYVIAYIVITCAHFFDFWHWFFRNLEVLNF